MNNCPHWSKIGDNYGLTCQDCGEVLEGYGDWGEGTRECQHCWEKLNETEDECRYCEAVRDREA